MNSLMEQLHDIEGLDAISMWPLAIGWWLLILASMFMMGLIGWFLGRWFAFKFSWKNDTFQKLAMLEKNLSEATARETLILLSEYLRRIALRRFSRSECAGLVGEAWLKWLAEYGPKQFDWKTNGALLLEVPYAQADCNLSVNQIKDLIKAVRNWVY